MQIRDIPLDEALWTYKEPEVFEVISKERAIELATTVALKGAEFVHKNPRVGAVFVDKEHRFLAAAAHLVYGQGHAEINLLLKIQERGLESSLDGATLYVTLEPCSHVGKTQSCAQALLKTSIKKVIYAMKDPNPFVLGRGISLLEEHGIVCEHSEVFQEKTEHLLDSFKWSLKHKTPFVALKAALTMNGVAAYKGDRKNWITSERARAYGHWLRMNYEAILVGAGTVFYDNPVLNVRHPYLKGRTPQRIVLDPHGRGLLARDISQQQLVAIEPEKTVWFCRREFWDSHHDLQEKLKERGVKCLSLERGWTLKTLLEDLGNMGIASLLVEGGVYVWDSFLKERFVNKIYLFQAPKIISGDTLHFASSVDDTRRLEYTHVTALAEDLLIETRFVEEF